MFLLGFRALYFENATKKNDLKKRYSDPYIPTQWILTAIMGDSLAPGGGPNTQEDILITGCYSPDEVSQSFE